MDTIVVRADAVDALDRALAVLRSGGLVAFPTDTVYGLGALAFDEAAIRSIYTVKGRGLEKAIPILLADPAELTRIGDEVSLMAQRLAAQFWPGPITLVVKRNPGLPEAVSTTDTVGVRIPDHPLARRLLRLTGPMAVTSANASGEQSASTADEVLAALRGRLPLILDGGRTPGGRPSTVIDCTHADPVLLRAGPISLDEVLRALQ